MANQVIPWFLRMVARKRESGDWHTPLMNCLAVALEHTTSTELKKTMEALSQQLTKIDECAHSITVTTKLPADVNIEDIIEALNYEHDVPISVARIGKSDVVEVTTNFRSSRRYAEETAVSNLQDAVKYCLSDPGIEWPVKIYPYQR